MLRPVPRLAAALLALAAGALPALAGDVAEPEVPFVRRVLGNGLRVLVHEDHRAPIVAVDVWYHTGSKNERPGRTGFAHLFEHLMFNGSEHADEDWFRAMASFGATGVNGTTNNDRTNYFETVPTGALDAVLWLESDRMGCLAAALTQAKLDEQRGVVQNEKRQGENRPYAASWTLLPALTYPAGHPYSWTVIGSMEDLNAASLEDVREWFRSWYGAANAVVVVCGDVDAEEALRKVEKYFGGVPPGPPVVRPGTNVAPRTGRTRLLVEERVPQGRVQSVWNTPGWGTRDAHLLQLAAAVLGRGEGSRLHERLVKKEGLATEVESFLDDMEIGGQFHAAATATPGADLERVEAVLLEEAARLAAGGPTAEELEVEKVQARASFLRRLERLGGFGGKADLLAECEVFGGRPDAWKARLADIAAATPAAVREVAARWLADGSCVVAIRPFPALAPAKEGPDRSAMPAVADPPEARFPDLERATLPTGLRVILARRPGLPLVRMDLLVDAGYAADPAGSPGIANLAGELLLGGTSSRTAREVRREADRLGAEIAVATEADTTRVSLTALRDSLAPAVALLADVVLHPAFPRDEVDLQRRRQVAAIAQERTEPRGMANRLLPRLLYGEGHPYAAPFSGSGTEASLEKATREDLVGFHRAWFRPGSATLVVTGDVTLAEVLPILQDRFGGWEPGTAPAKTLPPSAAPGKSRLYLLDRPGAPQSHLAAAQLVAPRGGPEEIPLSVLNTVFGGYFGSRLNMNLREDKHWSYGARSSIRDTRGPRALIATAPVQTDRTAESLAEMAKEIRAIAGGLPPTEEEVSAARSTMTLTLPGRWETSRAVSESVAEIVAFGLSDRYYDGYAARIRAVTPVDLAAAAKAIRPDAIVWLVVGDRRKIEKPVRDLGLAEVVVVDPEGRPVE